MVARARKPEDVAKGSTIATSTTRSISISMQPELINKVRLRAIVERRSFSNMMCILASRGIKEADVPK